MFKLKYVCTRVCVNNDGDDIAIALNQIQGILASITQAIEMVLASKSTTTIIAARVVHKPTTNTTTSTVITVELTVTATTAVASNKLTIVKVITVEVRDYY